MRARRQKAELLTRKEAEQAAKEKAKREVEEAKKAVKEAEAAEKLAKKEAEQAAREKAKRETEEVRKSRIIPKRERSLNQNPYIWAGLSLLVAGSLVSLWSYFVLLLIWLTALGISMLILSFILLALGRTIPKLSPEVSALLLETGIASIATIVEELGIRARAIYLPSSLTSGRPQALIPLHSDPALSRMTKALPQRLIVKYGANPDDIGLLVTTTGTTAVGMLESRPGPTSSELESALTSLFRGILGVADRTTIITRENHISVEIHNPRIENRTTWSHQCLGGPLASIVASVAAEAWDKPITIKQEEQHRGKYSIELEVIG